jgi:hypothetical protein
LHTDFGRPTSISYTTLTLLGLQLLSSKIIHGTPATNMGLPKLGH